jgi:hypothetical protein
MISNNRVCEYLWETEILQTIKIQTASENVPLFIGHQT